MPTAPNAINTSIDVLGWTHKLINGKRKNSQRYANWRAEVELKIKAKGWLWKKDAGNALDAFILECIALSDFPVPAASLIKIRPPTDNTKPSHKAVNELIIDCFKKVRESQSKRKRATAQEEIAAEAAEAEEADASGPAAKKSRYDAGRAVVMYILDPENATHHPAAATWHWNLLEVKKIRVLYEPSINELHLKFSANLPDGRKVREIQGALANSDPNDGALEKTPSDVTHIRSDDDLDAFLRLTEAKPIKLLIILHKTNGPNTPPPAGTNASKYYFQKGRFDGPEYYADEVEDSEAEVSKRAGGKKGVPRKDHTFEERLEVIRRRIRRQQDLLVLLEAKHKAAFPAAIHDGDPGGALRVLCYGRSDKLTGKQVVGFRQVVSDYLQEITQQTAAGGGQTAAQIEAAALNVIKTDINGAVYPALNLPNTLP